MGDLATYNLSDFILFSGSTYYRQFEIYNQAIWPLHMVAVLFACFVIYATWKKPASATRVIAAVLMISWLWVAYAFLYKRFYQIHVVANWYAFVFVIQAFMIGWYGLLNDRFVTTRANTCSQKAGLLLIMAAIFIYPLLASITGRAWQQFEMFALAPDPTAVGTLGSLLLYRANKALLIIPATWLLISYVTQSVM